MLTPTPTLSPDCNPNPALHPNHAILYVLHHSPPNSIYTLCSPNPNSIHNCSCTETRNLNCIVTGTVVPTLPLIIINCIVTGTVVPTLPLIIIPIVPASTLALASASYPCSQEPSRRGRQNLTLTLTLAGAIKGRAVRRELRRTLSQHEVYNPNPNLSFPTLTLVDYDYLNEP